MAERTAIYRFFNAEGTLLYVGVTNDIAVRWKWHAKQQPWWPEVVEQRATWHPTREAALAAEGRAINTESPLYNVNASPGSGMKNRVIRVSHADWEAFGAACERLGVTRSERMRQHMQARVNEWEAEKKQIADEDAEWADEREQRRIARESAD